MSSDKYSCPHFMRPPQGQAVLLCCLSLLLGTASSTAAQTPTPRLESPIKIVGADPQSVTGLKVVTSKDEFTFNIPIEVTKDIKNLRVKVDDFLAPNGATIVPTVLLLNGDSKQPINVTVQERPVIRVTATLPVSGEYKSYIVVVHDEGRVPSTPLTVTRQPGSINIGEPDPVRSTLFISANAEVRFPVNRGTGESFKTSSVTLERFSIVKDNKKYQAPYGSAVFHEERKQDSIGNDLVDPPKESQDQSTSVASGQPFTLKLSGITEAGEYSGTIRLANANGEDATKQFTLIVKESAWVALFCIFLGVFASRVIRKYTKEQRPQLVALRRLRYVKEDLEKVEYNKTASSQVVLQVFNWFRDSLVQIEQDLNGDVGQDHHLPRIEELGIKIRALPNWLNSGHLLDAVQPQSIIKAPRAAWDALADSYFLKPGVSVDIATALKNIESDTITNVNASINEFATTVQVYKSAHPEVVNAIEATVFTRVKKAQTAVTAREWGEASAELSKAQLGFTIVLALGLQTIIESSQLPLGFETAEWERFRGTISPTLNQILQEIDFERASELYRNVIRSYLNAVSEKLILHTIRLMGSGLTNAQQEKLGQATNTLTTAIASAKSGNFEEAQTAYNRAVIFIEEVQSERTAAGAEQHRAAAAAPAAALYEGVIPANTRLGLVSVLSSLPTRRLRTSQQVQEALTRYDRLMDCALFGIACLVGLTLLWEPEPIWGGWKAYMTSLLWGLGLHQVGGSTIEGLTGVRKKITEG